MIIPTQNRMANRKVVVTSDCRFDGKHLAAGTILEFDEQKHEESRKLAELVSAGRVADATPENIAKLKVEFPKAKAPAYVPVSLGNGK